VTVTLALVAAALATLVTWSTWRARRDFVAASGTFRCKVRSRSTAVHGIPSTWARRPLHALWVHDVLVLRRGLVRPRVWYLPVRMADGDLVELNPRRVRGLGRRPVSVRVLLDDREEIELAAADRDRSLLVGPFIAVAVGSLPGDAPPGARSSG
jgi:hypothetical protein